MKPTICLPLLLLTATLALSEYPRLKYRGPPPFPKPPPFQQFQKKWQQHPPRPPIRSSRPQPPSHIPVHMPMYHKIPMGMAASINRPVALPVRNFWKNTQTTFKPPPVNNNNNNINNLYMTSAPIPAKKVFQSSPAILAQEYDFQVESNNIPTPIKTIKQIGEKGPIHTIPAPNLSLADRPLVLQEVKKGVEEIRHQPDLTTYVQIQKSHQYQVTETPDTPRPPTYQNYQIQSIPSPSFSPNELYHLLNTYSQQPATITVPVLQDPQDYLQQYPSLIPQSSQNYVENPQEHVAMDKSFEEGTNKKELVTASYNLEPEMSESVIHSQYVQTYFDTRDSNNGGNNVEPDAKPSEKTNNNNNDNDNTAGEGYYVSLPNKEAAESLANLQAAGKLNSNLMQMGKNGEIPVSIYVPDDDKGQSEEEAEPSYDDYEEDLMTEEMSQNRGEEFGHRLKPK